MSDPLTILTDLLRELPGIGPRQARRLAYWFVRREKGWVEGFARALSDARRDMVSCTLCQRVFTDPQHATLCRVCADPARDSSVLLVVEKDVDLENIEKTGVYKGRYFVLGGTTSPLEKDPLKSVRVRELEKLLRDPSSSVREVVFALSATTEGEDTAAVVSEHIAPILRERSITQSALGRGLSTGTELEYVDTDTMRSAFTHRH